MIASEKMSSRDCYQCLWLRYLLCQLFFLLLLCERFDFLRRLGEVGMLGAGGVRLRVQLRLDQLPATA